MNSLYVILGRPLVQRVEMGMTKLVWHRHSCRCLVAREGCFRTGKSACATRFCTPPRPNTLSESPRLRAEVVYPPPPSVSPCLRGWVLITITRSPDHPITRFLHAV